MPNGVNCMSKEKKISQIVEKYKEATEKTAANTIVKLDNAYEEFKKYPSIENTLKLMVKLNIYLVAVTRVDMTCTVNELVQDELTEDIPF